MNITPFGHLLCFMIFFFSSFSHIHRSHILCLAFSMHIPNLTISSQSPSFAWASCKLSIVQTRIVNTDESNLLFGWVKQLAAGFFQIFFLFDQERDKIRLFSCICSMTKVLIQAKSFKCTLIGFHNSTQDFMKYRRKKKQKKGSSKSKLQYRMTGYYRESNQFRGKIVPYINLEVSF